MAEGGGVKIDLLCGICLMEYKKPKLLSCLHTFCEECLKFNVSVGAIVCPICEHKTSLPDGGLKSLKDNKIVEYDENDSEFGARCDGCMRPIGSTKCLDCSSTLCEGCVASHNYNYADHELKSLQDELLVCPEHQDQCQHYCKMCDELLCDKCLRSHEQHITFSLPEGDEDAALSIVEAINKCKQQVRNLQLTSADIEKASEKIQHEKTDKINLIEKKFEKLFEDLAKCKDKLIQKIEKSFYVQQKYLQVEKHSMYVGESLINHCCQFSEKVVGSNNHSGLVLAYKKDIMKRLCQLYMATSFLPSFQDKKFINCLPSVNTQDLCKVEEVVRDLALEDKGNVKSEVSTTKINWPKSGEKNVLNCY
ncbi:tripartite motif-containing protein 2-like [Saccoglossus kowalevskii]|uniref:Tripartite motif-containing protein 2-like n=1 Tax=Saccoglossus kowalevskii TaxID=10224 RepID=A0ABM0MR32_SACKO|nr:PREDICTED: tripartite motif-containing protein 2-like [Saccoglossus kowalevskii]